MDEKALKPNPAYSIVDTEEENDIFRTRMMFKLLNSLIFPEALITDNGIIPTYVFMLTVIMCSSDVIH